MPDQNTEVKNSFDTLQNAMKGISFVSPEASEIHTLMLQSMENLVRETDRLYKETDHSYPAMTEESFDHLTALYQDVLNVSGEYKKVLSGLTGADQKTGSSMTTIMDSVDTVLGKDLMTLSSAKEKGLTTLPEIVERARAKVVDISGQTIETSGANMSSRLKITVPGKDGSNDTTGYFTESFSTDYEKEFQELLSRAVAKNPDIDKLYKIMQEENRYGETRFDELLGRIESTRIFAVEGDVYQKNSKSPEIYTSVDHALDEFLPISEKEREALLRGTGLVQDFVRFAQETSSLKNKYDLLETAEITKNENIACRNSAMSTVADLLGMGNLIARSESMILTDKDKTYEGTFMEQAKGTDMMRCRLGDPLLHPESELEIEDTNVKKQIADLQILDYICGNADRHGGNMLYQIDSTDPEHLRLSGIQGIDNDCSFGTIRRGESKLPLIKNLGVIPESTARTVCCLDENMLKTVLRNYNFSDQELEAVWGRTKDLQDAIKDGYEFFKKNPEEKIQENHLRIVKDEEWASISTEKFDDIFIGSYFGTVHAVPSAAKSEYFAKNYLKSANDYRDSLSEYDKQGSGLRRLHSQLKKEDKWLLTGSRQYKNVMELVSNLENVHRSSMTQKSTEGIHQLMEEYDKTITAANAYLEYKMASFEEKVRGKSESEKQKELEKFQDPESRNFKRMAAVSELVSELKKYKKQAEDLLKTRENYENSRDLQNVSNQKKYLKQFYNEKAIEKDGSANEKRVLMSREELFGKNERFAAKSSAQKQTSKERKAPERQVSQPTIRK